MLIKTLAKEACLISLTVIEDIIDILWKIGGGIFMNVSLIGSGIKKVLSGWFYSLCISSRKYVIKFLE